MKVTLINTKDNGGGAAIACKRLMSALSEKNVEATMLVQHKNTGDTRITGIVKNISGRLRSGYHFLYERLSFILKERDPSVRFAFSPANSGTDISGNQVVLNADILHLHWINSGFLSVNNLKQVIRLQKPVIWTLHDMWAFTGGCHYSGICDHFENECGCCYFLKDPDPDDLSHTGWLRKNDMYAGADNIVFVACSNWLAGVARKSSLLNRFRIEAIPNPIDTDLFCPKNKAEVRSKWEISQDSKIILFGAANIADKRKGIEYLAKALDKFRSIHQASKTIEIVIFGKNKSFDTTIFPFKVHNLSTISSQDDMAEIYNLADVFILPSLEDNLPNTVMEAMACAIPVVAFNTGGIPDMIDHKVNGYLAEYKSADDLAHGIEWILVNRGTDLSGNARKKVLDNFSNAVVARQYIDLYQSVLNG